MLATVIVIGVCLAGTAFCRRFLLALRRECHRLLVCYVMRSLQTWNEYSQ